MTYTVKRLAGHRCQLTNELGTKLGIFRSRQEAKSIGRALAGWRGKVVMA